MRIATLNLSEQINNLRNKCRVVQTPKGAIHDRIEFPYHCAFEQGTWPHTGLGGQSL